MVSKIARLCVAFITRGKGRVNMRSVVGGVTPLPSSLLPHLQPWLRLCSFLLQFLPRLHPP
jgi:hypothetical protein